MNLHRELDIAALRQLSPKSGVRAGSHEQNRNDRWSDMGRSGGIVPAGADCDFWAT